MNSGNKEALDEAKVHFFCCAGLWAGAVLVGIGCMLQPEAGIVLVAILGVAGFCFAGEAISILKRSCSEDGGCDDEDDGGEKGGVA